MLCLPAPYGAPEGVATSITAPRERHAEIRQVCSDWGCPPFVLDRVQNAIRYSGRYDCFLGSGAASGLEAIRENLALYDAEITVTPTDSRDYLEFTRRRYIPALRNFRQTKEGYRIAQ
jgi:hypothetical protein